MARTARIENGLQIGAISGHHYDDSLPPIGRSRGTRFNW